MFIYHSHDTRIYVLVYVDDIIVTASDNAVLEKFIHRLAAQFSLKDLGDLSYFLGVEVQKHSKGLILNQRQYIMDILHRANMHEAKAMNTPLVVDPPLTKHGTAYSNPTEYRGILSCLQYLSLTRPHIAFAVNKLAQYMQNPTIDHWNALKRLLRYLIGTIQFGLLLRKDTPLNLHAFSDADWARDKDDYISTSAYIVYLGANPISWSSRKQRTRARSSTEAEYRAVASTTAELLWLQNLFSELRLITSTTPVIYCDNLGTTYVSANPVFHSKMKHLALDYHFVRENVQCGKLRVSYISTKEQLADALTKPLPRHTFHNLITKIGLVLHKPILRGDVKPIP